MIAAVDAAGGKLDLVLLTHHHGDHVAGTADLVARYGARVMGAKADAHRLPALDIAGGGLFLDPSAGDHAGIGFLPPFKRDRALIAQVLPRDPVGRVGDDRGAGHAAFFRGRRMVRPD